MPITGRDSGSPRTRLPEGKRSTLPWRMPAAVHATSVAVAGAGDFVRVNDPEDAAGYRSTRRRIGKVAAVTGLPRIELEVRPDDRGVGFEAKRLAGSCLDPCVALLSRFGLQGNARIVLVDATPGDVCRRPRPVVGLRERFVRAHLESAEWDTELGCRAAVPECPSVCLKDR